MQYEESYFQGEEREGFYVAPMMKRFWAAQMEVLQVIDQICEKHGIKYFAYAGTLLGAIRHKGFIPWDDDLDICMLREQYDAFYKAAKNDLPKGFIILTAKDDTYGTVGVNGLFMRVVNSNEIDFSDERMEKYHGCPYVVGVDIFVMDYVPRNKEDHELRNHLFDIVAGTARLMEKNELEEQDKIDNLAAIEELCNYQFNEETSLVGQLYYLADRISAMYTKEEADYVAIVRYRLHNEEVPLKKEIFDDIIRVPFEKITIPVPRDSHSVLLMRYGEKYMTPVRGGTLHDYPVYQDQERAVIKKFGGLPECIRYE